MSLPTPVQVAQRGWTEKKRLRAAGLLVECLTCHRYCVGDAGQQAHFDQTGHAHFAPLHSGQ